MTPVERSACERAAQEPMLEQVRSWAAINSGSSNLDGLERMAIAYADAFSALGEVVLIDPAPSDVMGTDGVVRAREHGRHLRLVVRPDAPVQLLLTGHMDTVYGAEHPFQQVAWREPGVLGGPGVADMKGGIAVMLAALKAVEASPGKERIGYEVLINSDEEVGSPSSATLIAEAAMAMIASGWT